MTLPQRPLGSGGLTASPIGIGCMEMSVHYGLRDAGEGTRCIERAVELGVTLFDTADVYGPYTNEELVGKALAPYRDRVNVSTKVGLTHSPDGPVPCGTPEHIARSCEGSLRRLGVDHLDLYYLHRADPKVPIEDTVGAMAELVAQGKVRFLGLSEATPATIRRAMAVHPIAALQSEWSLWSREIEAEVLPLAREQGIGIVPYCPLGRGFLTGSITSLDQLEAADIRRHSPWFQPGNFAHNVSLAREVRTMAGEIGCTATQLALAWLLAQGPDVFPIPGTDRVGYLQENVASFSVQIDHEVLKRLDELCATRPVAGRAGDSKGMMAGIETPSTAGDRPSIAGHTTTTAGGGPGSSAGATSERHEERRTRP